MQTFDVEFTSGGTLFAAGQVQDLVSDLDATDLIVVSHGWNNDLQEATDLYNELLGNVQRLLDLRANPQAPTTLRGLDGRTFAACRVYWPSKRFTDKDLIPGGGAASATVANDAALELVLDRLAEDPARLGDRVTSPARDQAVALAKALVPQLASDPDARAAYVDLLRSLVDADDSVDDDGAAAFFSADAEDLFDALDGPVSAPGAEAIGGGAGGRGADNGGAVGIRDRLDGAIAAARRLANLTTYLQMKSRAGTVGANGLASVIRRVRTEHPNIRVHLVGHSFGGRLVTAAAHALDDNTPQVTLSLLQAAFSHNGLSGDFGGGKAGAFREVLTDRRASGPILITHTKNDKAVGIAYPLASRIASQNAAALGDRNDPYGGMGRNGAQRTDEALGNETELAAVGHDYGFAPGKVYNLLADAFIADHGAVRGVQVAYAILSAASVG
ncbi:alpha/beta fold hydrolase [Nocardia rhizosphaerihabitans]|uniref:alpha/beta fold hydrolase n=1 Tax=Nocardia rhizosphaerihabitans TaxID=1691570 RepID=UPI00366D0626